ncbi:MAG: hypothetical protein ACR2P7_06105 [bacterium]
MSRGRVQLAVVFAVFLVPLLAAFVLYYGLDGAFAPRARSNHAALIAPPIALQQFVNPRARDDNDTGNDDTFDAEQIKRKWSVLHAVSDSCGDACARALYNTRQTRLALGKDGNRVQRIVLGQRAALERIGAEHPDAIQLLRSERGIERQLDPLRRAHGLGDDDALLIDPLGNIMMTIPATLDPALLLKDLKRLLKLSRIG